MEAAVSSTRRDFLVASAGVAAGLALPSSVLAHRLLDLTERPLPRRALAQPVVVSSPNGLRGVAKAYELMQRGVDPLDAAIAGVNIQELDPNDHSVGLGGLPNEDGVVQLDASCMHGPTRRAGAVAALEDIATPSLVAKAVMDYTDHIMLVGAGAKRFALEMGFKEQNLLTERSRQMWLRWKSKLNPNDNWLDHDEDVKISFTTGTINMNAVNAAGDIGSVTSTSGLSWKIPGRVGDSPILGAGLYVDTDVGAAGSTGRGEANLLSLASFLIVESMRRGMHPKDAGMAALQRIKSQTVARRLLNSRGQPNFGVTFYILNVKGEYAGVSMYNPSGNSSFAVCNENGPQNVQLEPLLTGSPGD
jgi:N4-(beta-N-acetylglucosaminyl)-L-asparaginase